MNRHRLPTLRSFPLLLAISAALMLCAAPAQACSICALAVADRILPPVGLWCLIGVLWFLGTVLIASFSKTRLPGVPGFVPGVFALAACILVGAGVTGPILVLPLFYVAVRGFVSSIIVSTSDEQARVRRGLRGLGYVASAVVVVTACGSVYLRQQRTSADFIVRWPNTGLAGLALEKLARGNTPDDRKQLRFVAEHATGAIAEKAEAALAGR